MPTLFFKSYFLLAMLSIGLAKGVTVEDSLADVNLTMITWAHAVNDQSYLTETLANVEINMIEADIQLGTLNGEGEPIPIMSHTDKTSDLSLQNFLDQIKIHNNNNAAEKGAKLDFKSSEAFTASIDIVASFDKSTFPIWINADILPGPINASATPVDASKFLEGAKSFPNSILSIGWTTEMNEEKSSGSYTKDQIDQMLKAITENKVTQKITFPVRAGLAAQSKEVLTTLIKEVDESTITIWSSQGDKVEVEDLRVLIKEIGVNRTYIDVPSDLLSQLHLDNLPNRSSLLSPSCFIFTLVGIFSQYIFNRF